MNSKVSNALLVGGLALVALAAAACSPGASPVEAPSSDGTAISVYQSPT